MRVFLLCALCLCAFGGIAAAESARSYSASDWIVVRNTVILRVSLPAAAVSLIDRRVQTAPTIVQRYVLGHVAVYVGGTPCPALDQGEGVGQIDALAPEPDLSRYEMVFTCPAAGTLWLDNRILFDLDTNHLDFGNVHIASRSNAALIVFDEAHQRAMVPADGAPADTNVARFIGLGAAHTLGSVVRLAVVLLLGSQLRGRLDWVLCAAAVTLSAGAATGLALGEVAAARPAAAEAGLQMLLLLLAVRAAAMGWRLGTFAILSVVIGTLIVAKVSSGDLASVQMLAGEALLAPVLLIQTPRTRRLSFLLPATLLGLIGDASFGDALRNIGLPLSAAWRPMVGHEFGTVLTVLLIAVAAAASWRIVGGRGLTKLAWVPDFVRTGLAGYAVFLIAATPQV